MIPLREQESIRERFREELKGRVKIDFFTQRPTPVFVPGREDCEFCPQTETLLEEMAHLSDQIDLRIHELGDDPALEQRYGIERAPATVVRGVINRPVVFLGIPTGNIFPVVLEAVVMASGDAPQPPPAARRRLKRLKRNVRVQVFVTPAAPYCPEMALLAAIVGLASPHIRAEIIEISEFPRLAESMALQVVPTTVIDGKLTLTGMIEPDALVEQITRAAEMQTVPAARRLISGAETRSGTPISSPPPAPTERGTVRPSGLIIPGR